MKVKEFIKFLETQDQEAVVNVLEYRFPDSYYRWVEFDVNKHVEIYSTDIYLGCD